MNLMSLTSESETLGLSNDSREIFFLLLKKSPLTIGELCFLSKKTEENLKLILKILIDSGFVREIDETIPLYIALYPTLLLKSNLDSFLKQLDEFESNFKNQNNSDLDAMLKSLESFKTEFQNNSTELISQYETDHTASIQQLENQSQTIIKNSIQSQTDILKDISNDFSGQKSATSNSITTFSNEVQNFSTQFYTKFDTLIDGLQAIIGQNKKQLRKTISDTIKSLDEGAKLLGKNVNDQLKVFEGKLIDSINSSISATVDLSNGFKNLLTEDYSTWKVENSDFGDKIQSEYENLITESVSSNLEVFNTNVVKIIEKLTGFLDNYNKIIGEIAKKSIKLSEDRSSAFVKEIELKTTKFNDFFKSVKADFDTNKDSYTNSVEEYEKKLNLELKSFLGISIQQFEETFKIVTQILSEFITNARTSFDKEYSQILTDNSDILDRIIETLTLLKNNYENELTDLQNNIESLENGFKDLSVAIKRRFDKFSSDSSSHIQSMGNKIIDELLRIQSSNIEILEEHKTLKQNFATVINTFISENSNLKDESQAKFNAFSKDILDQKIKQLEKIEKETKDYGTFINERHSILDNQLKTKNDEFINDFKGALSKTREEAQVIIQTEQVEYLKNLTEINSNSDILLLQERDRTIEALDSLSNSLAKNIQDALDLLTQTFNKIKSSLVNEIDQHKTSFSQTFTDINSHVEEISQNYITNYKSVLESSINSLKNVEVTYWTKFEDTFSKNKEKVLEIYKTNTESLQNKTNSVIKSLNSFLDEMVQSISNLNTEISGTLDILSSDITDKFTEIQDSTNSQFQAFEDISSSLDQISQKSKLQIENELLDIGAELKQVTNKNFESFTQLMNTSTTEFNKTLDNLSEGGAEQIESFEKEIKTSVQTIKQDIDTNKEAHLNNLLNISKESLNDLNTKTTKQLASIKESKLQLEEKTEILTENLVKGLIEIQITYQNKIDEQFDTLIDSIPETLKNYFTDFKSSVKELIDTLNQIILKEITDNSTTTNSLFKNTQTEGQKAFQLNLNQLKTKFTEQITAINDEFQETSKLRLEEIEMQVNKELESFQIKLVKKENDDVKKLRELIQSINSVGIFNELVNDNLIHNIDPLKDNFEISLNSFQSDVEKLFQNSGLNQLTDVQQKTIADFSTLLINAYNSSISKLNTIQKSFSEQMNIFQANIKNFMEKTIEKTKTNELDLILSNEEKILGLQESEIKLISDFVNKAMTSYQINTSKLNELVKDYNTFFNSIHSVLVQPDKEVDNLYKNRLINVPDDISKYLGEIISRTDKRIDLILPKPEILDLKPIIDLHTRVMIKIVINLDPKIDKTEKRKAWVSELYKRKANVQLYDTNNVSNLIICVRDNKETLIIANKKENELTPGFIIENSLFSDYFSKSFINNLISGAKPISRENSK